MLTVLTYVKDRILAVLRDERAQDGFEYLLVIGGVSVAVIVAIATPVGDTMIDAVVNGTCAAINSVDGAGGNFNISCTFGG